MYKRYCLKVRTVTRL